MQGFRAEMQDSSKTTEVHLAALKEKQEQTLRSCEDKLNRWMKLHDDYIALKKKLETLADQLTYDTLVPYGNAGLMRGKLIHTNEIMVLLGDNWFVERSSKQAAEIVNRRIKQCTEAIDGYEKEKVLILNWKNFTDQMSEDAEKGFREITEPYDADKEKIWKEQHIKSRQKEKLLDKVSRQDTNVEDKWKKLDELEQQEIRRHEFSRETDDNDDGVPAEENEKIPDAHCILKDKSKTKKVGWAPDKDLIGVPANEPLKMDTSHLIQSPSDIYKYFGGTCNDSKNPKSILKQPTVQPNTTTIQEPSTSLEIHDEGPPPVKFANTEKAFPGVVVERISDASAKATHQEINELPKRMSKFKAQRAESQ